MADLGNVSVQARPLLANQSMGVAPAAWPDVGLAVRVVPAVRFAPLRGANKQPAGVTIDIPTSAGRVVLLEAGQLVSIAQGVAGHTYFYDLNDGEYYAHTANGTGVWRVIVSGETANVTALTESPTRAFGFVVT